MATDFAQQDAIRMFLSFAIQLRLMRVPKRLLLVPSKYIEFVNRDENIGFDEKMTTLKKGNGGTVTSRESKKDLLKSLRSLSMKSSSELVILRRSKHRHCLLNSTVVRKITNREWKY